MITLFHPLAVNTRHPVRERVVGSRINNRGLNLAAIRRTLVSAESENVEFATDLVVSLQGLASAVQENVAFATDPEVSLQRLASAGRDAEANYREALAILARFDDGRLTEAQRGWAPLMQVKLGRVLGNLTCAALRDNNYGATESFAHEALTLAPGEEWIKADLAQALMFQWRIAEADAIYLRMRGRTISWKTWEEVILDNFRVMRTEGLAHPNMMVIEAAFAE